MNDTDRASTGSKDDRGGLGKKKYSIDYYQREYKWGGQKQITDLVNDLTTKFADLYDPQHARKGCRAISGLLSRVDHYFSKKGSHPIHRRRQRRMTTLTYF